MGIFKVIRNTNDELDYLYNVLNYTMGIHVVSRFASPGLISLDEGFVKWRGNKIYFITVVGRFRGVFVARCERDQ